MRLAALPRSLRRFLPTLSRRGLGRGRVVGNQLAVMLEPEQGLERFERLGIEVLHHAPALREAVGGGRGDDEARRFREAVGGIAPLFRQLDSNPGWHVHNARETNRYWQHSQGRVPAIDLPLRGRYLTCVGNDGTFSGGVMARMRMTQAVARAIATDAGNASMQAAGRTSWSADDYNAAAREYERVFPVVMEMADHGQGE